MMMGEFLSRQNPKRMITRLRLKRSTSCRYVLTTLNAIWSGFETRNMTVDLIRKRRFLGPSMSVRSPEVSLLRMVWQRTSISLASLGIGQAAMFMSNEGLQDNQLLKIRS